MRPINQRPFQGISALALVAAAVSINACVAGDTGPVSRERVNRDRVHAVESGLLTDRVIKGQPGMSLRERMAHYKVPGVSIAVINDGTLEWAKGYGVLEAGTTTAVTQETRFQAASISKPVSAMAALSLVQQGTLNLDDDVNRRLTSWHLPENAFTRTGKVTLERLLRHRAGLGIDHFAGYAQHERVPTVLQALDGRPPANSGPVRVELVPGRERRYSGGGYLVLQQLIADVAGAPFAEVLQRLVLDKIGMTQSTYEQTVPQDWETKAAAGHDVNGAPIRGRWHAYPEMAAAGLWTTPSDLGRLVIELQQSMQGRSNKILSPEMTARLVTTGQQGEALGFSAWGSGPSAVFSHGGANHGFRAMLFAYTNTGRGAIVMANGNGGDALLSEIMRAIAGEYNWPDYRPTEKVVIPIDPRIIDLYVGEYSEEGTWIRVTKEGPQLYVQTPPLGPAPLKLYPATERRFFLLEGDIELTFVPDPQGKISTLQVNALGTAATARRVN